VGYYNNGSALRTLILHWNGAAWKVQPSPNVGVESNVLNGVFATSPTNVWAIGSHGSLARTLILHWNGHA
jgi:hypothetical protein